MLHGMPALWEQYWAAHSGNDTLSHIFMGVYPIIELLAARASHYVGELIGAPRFSLGD